jgi:hypothetical protein
VNCILSMWAFAHLRDHRQRCENLAVLPQRNGRERNCGIDLDLSLKVCCGDSRETVHRHTLARCQVGGTMSKILAATISVVLMAIAGMAQSASTMRIPFPFCVGDMKLPAGSPRTGRRYPDAFNRVFHQSFR